MKPRLPLERVKQASAALGPRRVREARFPRRGDPRTGVVVTLPWQIVFSKDYAAIAHNSGRKIAAAEWSEKLKRWTGSARGRAHFDMARNVRPIDVRLAYHLKRVLPRGPE